MNSLTIAASGMYAARAKTERSTHSGLYARNPDAEQFYFRGVKDVLTTIAVVRHDGATARTLSTVMAALADEATRLVAGERLVA